jgi:hypothetical protein
MTSLNHDPLAPQQAGQAATSPQAPVVRSAVSADLLQEHAADRWDRFAVAAAQRSDAGRRSFQIVAAVIAVGVLAWMLLTF